MPAGGIAAGTPDCELRNNVLFFENALAEETSASTGRPCVFGYTPSGEHIIVVFEEIDAHTIYPITAYEVPERE